jgi:malic enzyme
MRLRQNGGLRYQRFSCANPVPDIWPYAAKEEGAYIVATGRGDFLNQVNNSICFPGILKGALTVRAKKITDGMAIRCAHSLAEFSEKCGISPDNIRAIMEETEVFVREAQQAIKEGVEFCYYPGCTLKTKAKELNVYGRNVAKTLGVTMTVVEDWHCYGAVYPMATDEIVTRQQAIVSAF